ncbi:transcriptional regulator, partial [Acinetobacter baumannii]
MLFILICNFSCYILSILLIALFF